MEIYANNCPTSFGCIRIKSGGAEFINKEGNIATGMLSEIKDQCSRFRWHLDVNSDGYSLTCPTNSKSYKGPFTPKRNWKKHQLLISMKNENDRTVSFPVICRTSAEVSEMYLKIRHSKGFEKMLKILKLLENKQQKVL